MVLAQDMVSVDMGEMSAGSPITVTVEYEYQMLTPFVNEWVPDGVLIMKATVTQPIIGDGL